jgi:hypothetical protein
MIKDSEKNKETEPKFQELVMTHNLIDNMIDSIKKLYEGFKK